MTIFGDQDATKQFQLTRTKQGDAAKFSEGTTNEFEMNLVDVGQVNRAEKSFRLTEIIDFRSQKLTSDKMEKEAIRNGL